MFPFQNCLHSLEGFCDNVVLSLWGVDGNRRSPECKMKNEKCERSKAQKIEES